MKIMTVTNDDFEGSLTKIDTSVYNNQIIIKAFYTKIISS
jgi:hypothetical protein